MKPWMIGVAFGLALILVAGGFTALGWRLGYSRGAEDASCYAVQAGAGSSTVLPLDMAPCPEERRP